MFHFINQWQKFKMTRIMSIVLCFMLIFLSACKSDSNDERVFDKVYGDMRFRVKYDKEINSETGEETFIYDENGEKTFKYCAGRFDKSDSYIESYFIPYSINYIPVVQLGYPIYLNNDAGTIIDHEELNKLYIPGRIDSVYSSQRYVSYYRKDGNQINDRNNLIIYYCGEVLALWGIGIPSDFYVPAERFDEFVNYQSEHESMSYQYNIKKANISYRLNAEDLAEYYYVDYVDYGEKITNIPPEPERYGYTFDGWYTESDCITKWNFNTPTQTLADDQDFMELKLYAKWTTK